MAKATVQMSSGAVVTVEGSSEEVAALVRKLDTPAIVQHSATAGRRDKRSARATASGPSGLVLRLRQEGFFDKPHSLGDITDALQERGYIVPVTTLSGIALKLLKSGWLHRKKEQGKWVYGK